MVGTTIGVWICLTTSNECHVHHWHCSAFISKCYKWSLKIDYSLIICIWSLSTAMPRIASFRSFCSYPKCVVIDCFLTSCALYLATPLPLWVSSFSHDTFCCSVYLLTKSVHICIWVFAFKIFAFGFSLDFCAEALQLVIFLIYTYIEISLLDNSYALDLLWL